MHESTAKNKQSKEKVNFRRYIIWFWALFLAGILLIILIFLMASRGAFGPMPTLEDLENPKLNLSTEIFTSDGHSIGRYYKENRSSLKYEDIPQNLINAIVATEDERYYSHSGIDLKGTLRAAFYLGQKGGGSTITQQLAKLLFTEKVSGNTFQRIIQKVKEWIIAIRLERQYTKEEIITKYLNKFDFIYQAVGIRSAANIYFNKEPRALKTEEAAVLTAMLKNPSYYNPLTPEFQDKSLLRRNLVLAQMQKNGYLTQKEKDSLQQIPLKTKYTPQDHDEGIATYFRVFLQKFLLEWIKENPKPNGQNYNLYRDGLKIYTSIDSGMQQYAEEAVDTHLSNLQQEFNRQNKTNKIAPFRDISLKERDKIIENAMRRSERWKILSEQGKSVEEIKRTFDKKTEMTVFTWAGDKRRDTIMTPRDSILYYKSFLQAGMLSMEPQTGEVKAWVGGIDFKNFKYDHVKQGKRQVGSTFKPFVYATAIDQLHYSPCYRIPRSKHTIEAGTHGITQDWTPKNSGNEYAGMVTLKNALAKSINTVTARLIDRIGIPPVIDLLKELGIDTEDIPPVPSIALGSADINVFDMVYAFSVFVNKGIYVEPVIVKRIEDKNGTLIYQHVPKTRDVISEETAYVTVNLLEGVTQFGSGTRLRGDWAKENSFYQRAMTGYPYEFKNPIAGKTGTTQNQSDGWFIGMVPNLVTGVWVGAEDRSVHFPGIRYGQGATMALPIWGIYMKNIYADKRLNVSQEEFKRPEDLSIETDCKDLAQEVLEDQNELPDELQF